MNGLQKFTNSEFGSIRTLTVNNEPYFVGKDVAEALGYVKSRNALSTHVSEEDKKEAPIQGDLGGVQQMTIINESGLYSLIFGSKLESAKRFKHWVTSDVLPSIRRHGVYAIDEMLENPDMLIATLTQLKKERKKSKELAETVAIQNQQIIEMKPKASYYDVVLNCRDLVAISVIAKDYGWTANRMNQYLHEKGIQFKQGNKIWLLYKDYAQMGLTSTKTHTYGGSDGKQHSKPHTYWTQKGRLFIYDLLKTDGILPMIEKGEECDK